VPRPPLRDCDPAWVARQAGLSNEIIALIDADRASNMCEPQINY
jgi:hypothetical protein